MARINMRTAHGSLEERLRRVQADAKVDPAWQGAEAQHGAAMAEFQALVARFEQEQPVLAQAIKKLESEHWFQAIPSGPGGDTLTNRAYLALANKVMKLRVGLVERYLRELFIIGSPSPREWAQMLVDGAPRPADFAKLSVAWTVDYREVLASVCQPTTITTRKKASSS